MLVPVMVIIDELVDFAEAECFTADGQAVFADCDVVTGNLVHGEWILCRFNLLQYEPRPVETIDADIAVATFIYYNTGLTYHSFHGGAASFVTAHFAVFETAQDLYLVAFAQVVLFDPSTL